MATPTLVRYGCGCIGFPLDSSMTKEVRTTDRDGNVTVALHPCIINECDSDCRADDFGLSHRWLNPENMNAAPLLPEEEDEIWRKIFALVGDGYCAREIKRTLDRIK